MSGGSLDYAYGHVQDAADSINGRSSSYPKQKAIYKAFAAHLRLIAKALHDVEWVFSADCGTGDDVASMRAVLSQGAELEAAVANAEEARQVLDDALKHAKESIHEKA